MREEGGLAASKYTPSIVGNETKQSNDSRLKLGVILLFLLTVVAGIRTLLPTRNSQSLTNMPAQDTAAPFQGRGFRGGAGPPPSLGGLTVAKAELPSPPPPGDTMEEFFRTTANAGAIRGFSLKGLISTLAANVLLGEPSGEAPSDAVIAEILSVASDPASPLLLRRYCLASLGQDRRDSVVSTLMGLAAQQNEDVTLQSGALWALGGRIAERGDVAAVFHQALASEEDQVRFAALFNLGRSALDIPISLLIGIGSEADWPLIAAEAVSLLGERFGEKAIPHLRQISEVSSGASPMARHRANHVLETLAEWGKYLRDTSDAFMIKRSVTVDGVSTQEEFHPIAFPPRVKR